MKPKFEFYERPNGHNEFIEFLNSYLRKTRKMLAVIANVEEHGILIAQK